MKYLKISFSIVLQDICSNLEYRDFSPCLKESLKVWVKVPRVYLFISSSIFILNCFLSIISIKKLFLLLISIIDFLNESISYSIDI